MSPRPLYFVLASFGNAGTAWVERDPNDCDRETTIRDLIDGQIEDPLQVIEVDPDEGTSRDVSEDIAREIADRVRREPIPQALINFIWDAASPALARELRAA
jgi:hypothetical protein